MMSPFRRCLRSKNGTKENGKQVKLKLSGGRPRAGRRHAKLKRAAPFPRLFTVPRINRSRLQLSARDIIDVEPRFRRNILVELEIDGEKSNRLALVKEIQHRRWGATFCISIFMPCRWMKPFKPDVPLEALASPMASKTLAACSNRVGVRSRLNVPRDCPTG